MAVPGFDIGPLGHRNADAETVATIVNLTRGLTKKRFIIDPHDLSTSFFVVAPKLSECSISNPCHWHDFLPIPLGRGEPASVTPQSRSGAKQGVTVLSMSEDTLQVGPRSIEGGSLILVPHSSGSRGVCVL